jgi:hypothetical protein
VANPDGGGPDATMDVGGGGPDSSADSPSGDTSPGADGGSDSRVDAPVDSGPPIDGSPVPVGDFPKQATAAYCKHLGECCTVPAADWNENGCESLFHSIHEYASIGVYMETKDAGPNVLLDPILAAKCLNELATFSCGTITAAEYTQIRVDCFTAMKGQVPVGQSAAFDGGPTCQQSNECQSGYCSVDDGGPGTCKPLETAGGNCGQPQNTRSEECTFLGLGTPAQNYCLAPGDGGQATCVGDNGFDAGCNVDWECQTDLCGSVSGPPVHCTDKSLSSDPGIPGGICDYFTIKDAGGGG